MVPNFLIKSGVSRALSSILGTGSRKPRCHSIDRATFTFANTFQLLFPFSIPVTVQLYIILIRPERNVRQSMMPVRYSAINKTSNSGQSMMAAVMVTAATCNQKEKIEKHVPTPTDELNGECLLFRITFTCNKFRRYSIYRKRYDTLKLVVGYT